MEFVNNQSELVNKYKSDGKEIIVLTGRNPICPPGFKIINTNINDRESDTKVIVCAKGDIIDNNIIIPKVADNKLDYTDVLSLAVSDNDYNRQNFPFTIRDDSFISDVSPSYYNPQIYFVILLFIVAFAYYINIYMKKEKNINIEKENIQ